MVYALLEVLVCVSLVVAPAVLVFMLCAAVLLTREVLTRIFRTPQKATATVVGQR